MKNLKIFEAYMGEMGKPLIKIGDMVDVYNPKGKYGSWMCAPDSYLYNCKVVAMSNDGSRVTVEDANQDQYIVELSDVTRD